MEDETVESPTTQALETTHPSDLVAKLELEIASLRREVVNTEQLAHDRYLDNEKVRTELGRMKAEMQWARDHNETLALEISTLATKLESQSHRINELESILELKQHELSLVVNSRSFKLASKLAAAKRRLSFR